MDPATIALIIKGVTLGADLLQNGLSAYQANKDTFTSDDIALINKAIADVSALNDVKEAAALAALDEAAKA